MLENIKVLLGNVQGLYLFHKIEAVIFVMKIIKDTNRLKKELYLAGKENIKIILKC